METAIMIYVSYEGCAFPWIPFLKTPKPGHMKTFCGGGAREKQKITKTY
jgi:hypothetical protein